MDLEPYAREGAARIVALMVGANDVMADDALQALERADAFRALGIRRERFAELVALYASDVGSHLSETSWLRDGDRKVLDDLLQRVTDPDERRLVCRLVAIVIEARHCVSEEERLLHTRLRAMWHESLVPATAP